MSIRLNKFLSECGVASRRKADVFIDEGRILINNVVVKEKGIKIVPGRDKIVVNGSLVRRPEKKRYLVLNKPKNVITTLKDEHDRETVMSYIEVTERVYPIGRLDRNTTGVLLFTNDGDLARRLMSAKFEVRKEYVVTLDKKISEKDLSKIRSGMRLKDTGEKVLPCEAKIEGNGESIWLAVTEGKNHQIKRMLWSVGYDVKKLSRVTYGGISLKGLKRGQVRNLTIDEVRHLQKITKMG